MYQRTVLIVEDEPLIRLTLADALEDEGFNVLEAATVLEAVAVLGHNPVDAVITDIDMPGALSGIDLAEFLQVSVKKLPVIVTSGGRLASNRPLPAGTLFVPKPYPLSRMIEMLNALLAGGLSGGSDVNEAGAHAA